MKNFLGKTSKMRQREVYNDYQSLIKQGVPKMEAAYTCMDKYGYLTVGAIYLIKKRIEKELAEEGGAHDKQS